VIIKVKVNTNSKTQSIEKNGDLYIVKFKATREKGKANEKLIKILAEYFAVASRDVSIIHGNTSTIKTVQILQR
jgi:uncharacterized protein (TIGR00251 family)